MSKRQGADGRKFLFFEHALMQRGNYMNCLFTVAICVRNNVLKRIVHTVAIPKRPLNGFYQKNQSLGVSKLAGGNILTQTFDRFSKKGFVIWTKAYFRITHHFIHVAEQLPTGGYFRMRAIGRYLQSSKECGVVVVVHKLQFSPVYSSFIFLLKNHLPPFSPRQHPLPPSVASAALLHPENPYSMPCSASS